MIEQIHSPEDLKKLTLQELNELSGEIRKELITTVSRNGGHLASNLGVVELTLAIHRVFDTPRDKIIFDVGHQSYVHKLVTGRWNRFGTLREYGGLSGFPSKAESDYDCFETGHASTAISAALGMARARDYRGETHQVVALVGDGALTGGMCYEALNDAGNSQTQLIVILNDNEMSIAPNVGALSRYLTRLRFSTKWQTAKKRVRHLSDLPAVGKPLYRLIHTMKKSVKTLLIREGDTGFFEALGFEYFGPIDGHDIPQLEDTFRLAKEFKGPCVIHVMTRKGYGYVQAEERPEAFHGTPPFFIETGDRIDLPGMPSCGHVMADTLAEMTREDNRVLAITAAMKLGTGLDHYEALYPDRVLDVGIAEEHAATLASGLAAGGMRPYFAVYASFFQRCYDQLIHDVCMQNLSVTFLLDRSGVGGEDGKTHHGLLDFAESIPVPNLTVLAPCDADELRQMLRWTLTREGPCVIRYAKSGKLLPESASRQKTFSPGKWSRLTDGADAALLAVGSMVPAALKTGEILEKQGFRTAVWNCSTVKPLDGNTLQALHQHPFFTLEEHMLTGGFGAYVCLYCREHGLTQPSGCFAVEDRYLPHGGHEKLLEEAGLTPEQIASRMLEHLRREPK